MSHVRAAISGGRPAPYSIGRDGTERAEGLATTGVRSRSLAGYGDLVRVVVISNPGSLTWKRRQPLPTYGVLSLADGRVRSTAIVELLAPRPPPGLRSGARRA